MSLSASRIATDVRFSLLQFARNRLSLFFTLAFPGLFMLVLGYLLSFQARLTHGATDVSTIAYLFPGIVGMCIMFTAINETMSVIVRYRTTGLAHKLSATPLSIAEWNLAKIVTGTLIMLLGVTVALATGILAFGVRPDLNAVTVLLVVTGSVMFVGLGMIIASFVSDLKSVNAISFSATLPLMLLSGSLFPVERLPVILQFASIFSPLTCLTNGLRGSMITGDMGNAIGNLFGGVFLAMVLFAVGVAIRMKDDGQDM